MLTHETVLKDKPSGTAHQMYWRDVPAQVIASEAEKPRRDAGAAF